MGKFKLKKLAIAMPHAWLNMLKRSNSLPKKPPSYCKPSLNQKASDTPFPKTSKRSPSTKRKAAAIREKPSFTQASDPACDKKPAFSLRDHGPDGAHSTALPCSIYNCTMSPTSRKICAGIILDDDDDADAQQSFNALHPNMAAVSHDQAQAPRPDQRTSACSYGYLSTKENSVHFDMQELELKLKALSSQARSRSVHVSPLFSVAAPSPSLDGAQEQPNRVNFLGASLQCSKNQRLKCIRNINYDNYFSDEEYSSCSLSFSPVNRSSSSSTECISNNIASRTRATIFETDFKPLHEHHVFSGTAIETASLLRPFSPRYTKGPSDAHSSETYQAQEKQFLFPSPSHDSYSSLHCKTGRSSHGRSPNRKCSAGVVGRDALLTGAEDAEMASTIYTPQMPHEPPYQAIQDRRTLRRMPDRLSQKDAEDDSTAVGGRTPCFHDHPYGHSRHTRSQSEDLSMSDSELSCKNFRRFKLLHLEKPSILSSERSPANKCGKYKDEIRAHFGSPVQCIANEERSNGPSGSFSCFTKPSLSALHPTRGNNQSPSSSNVSGNLRTSSTNHFDTSPLCMHRDYMYHKKSPEYIAKRTHKVRDVDTSRSARQSRTHILDPAEGIIPIIMTRDKEVMGESPADVRKMDMEASTVPFSSTPRCNYVSANESMQCLQSHSEQEGNDTYDYEFAPADARINYVCTSSYSSSTDISDYKSSSESDCATRRKEMKLQKHVQERSIPSSSTGRSSGADQLNIMDNHIEKSDTCRSGMSHDDNFKQTQTRRAQNWSGVWQEISDVETKLVSLTGTCSRNILHQNQDMEGKLVGRSRCGKPLNITESKVSRARHEDSFEVSNTMGRKSCSAIDESLRKSEAQIYPAGRDYQQMTLETTIRSGSSVPRCESRPYTTFSVRHNEEDLQETRSLASYRSKMAEESDVIKDEKTSAQIRGLGGDNEKPLVSNTRRAASSRRGKQHTQNAAGGSMNTDWKYGKETNEFESSVTRAGKVLANDRSQEEMEELLQAKVMWSYNMRQDFRESMRDVLLKVRDAHAQHLADDARNVNANDELLELVGCYLALNPPSHHASILYAFGDLCSQLFD